MYFDESELRLRFGTAWTEVEFLTEVGVVVTRRGYVPAAKALRGSTPHLVLIGAASLSAQLDAIRKERGGELTGAKVRIRKVRDESTSPYEAEAMA